MTSRGREKLLSKRETSVNGFQIPKNVMILDELFTDSTNIHTLTNGHLSSGSNVTEKQFIGLRIICPEYILPHAFEEHLVTFGLSSVWENAKQLVNTSHELSVFLRMVENNVSVAGIYEESEDNPGSFKPVKRALEQMQPVETLQQQNGPVKIPQTRTSFSRMTSSRSSHPSKVDKPKLRLRLTDKFIKKAEKDISEEQMQGYQFGAEEAAEEADPTYTEKNAEAADEATPNAAIILLLQGITDFARNSMVEWTFDHSKLHAAFGNGDYNAWTDGALRQTSQRDNILAIVEAKRHTRMVKAKEICMQEGAESACWVLRKDSGLPKLNGHRVLISQDYDETWVTFISYGDNYLAYLNRGEKQGQVAQDSHMTMQTVGPFISDSARDMWSLAVLITAISLRC